MGTRTALWLLLKAVYLSLVIIVLFLLGYVGTLLRVLLVLRVEIVDCICHDVLRVHRLLQNNESD